MLTAPSSVNKLTTRLMFLVFEGCIFLKTGLVCLWFWYMNAHTSEAWFKFRLMFKREWLKDGWKRDPVRWATWEEKAAIRVKLEEGRLRQSFVTRVRHTLLLSWHLHLNVPRKHSLAPPSWAPFIYSVTQIFKDGKTCLLSVFLENQLISCLQ